MTTTAPTAGQIAQRDMIKRVAEGMAGIISNGLRLQDYLRGMSATQVLGFLEAVDAVGSIAMQTALHRVIRNPATAEMAGAAVDAFLNRLRQLLRVNANDAEVGTARDAAATAVGAADAMIARSASGNFNAAALAELGDDRDRVVALCLHGIRVLTRRMLRSRDMRASKLVDFGSFNTAHAMTVFAAAVESGGNDEQAVYEAALGAGLALSDREASTGDLVLMGERVMDGLGAVRDAVLTVPGHAERAWDGAVQPVLRTAAQAAGLIVLVWAVVQVVSVTCYYHLASDGRWAGAMLWLVAGVMVPTLAAGGIVADILSGVIGGGQLAWNAAKSVLYAVPRMLGAQVPATTPVRDVPWVKNLRSLKDKIVFGVLGQGVLWMFFSLAVPTEKALTLSLLTIMTSAIGATLLHFHGSEELKKSALARAYLTVRLVLGGAIITVVLASLFGGETSEMVKKAVDAGVEVGKDGVRTGFLGVMLGFASVGCMAGAVLAAVKRLPIVAVTLVLFSLLFAWRETVRWERLPKEEPATVRAPATPPPDEGGEKAPTDAELKALGDAFDGI